MARKRETSSKAKPAAGPAPKPSWPHWPEIWPYFAIAALAFGVYAATLSNGFVWDDSAQLLKNPAVVDFHRIPGIFKQDVWAFEHNEGTPKSNYYRPIPILTYMGMYYLTGFNSFAFHFLMMLIHTANALLVFFLFSRLSPRFSGSREAALFAAALFAVHPIHTEAVVWVAALPDVLVTLLALVLLVRFIRQNASPSRLQIVGYGVLYFAALLTKETGVVLLPLLLGYEWLYLGRSSIEIWKNRLLYCSLLLVLCVYLALRVQALGGLAPAQGRNIQLGAREFVLSAIAIAGRYLGKLVLPTNLSSYHIFEPVVHLNLAVFLSLASIIGVAAAIFTFRRTARLVSFASFFTVIPLVPVLNLTGVGEAVFAERYLYLPSVGFAWIAGLGWSWLFRRSRIVARSAAIAVFVLFSYGVTARIPDWHDDITLYRVTARQYPNSAHIRTMLGQFYQSKGENSQALAEYRAAVRIDPKNAVLHNSFATVLAQSGHSDEALEELRKSTTLDPSYWPGFVNLATLFDRAGQADKAAAAFEHALKLKPDSVQALNGVALARRQSKDYTAAVELLRRAVGIDPNFTEGHLNLGLVYDDMARYAEAASAFRRAIEVGGEYPFLYLAHYGLGVADVRLNLMKAATAEFTTTLLLNPDYTPARQALEKTSALLRN